LIDVNESKFVLINFTEYSFCKSLQLEACL